MIFHQLKRCFFGVIALAFSSISFAQSPTELLLKNYKPQSIFKIPETQIQKAKYPIIDMHSHDNSSSAEEIDAWVKVMDCAGIAKSMILSYTTGAYFD
jgi:hypothetical protein